MISRLLSSPTLTCLLLRYAFVEHLGNKASLKCVLDFSSLLLLL